MRSRTWQRACDRLRQGWRAANEVLYGMSTFDWAREARRARGEAEYLFALLTFGDIIGIPILPPYYALRLLPYVVHTLDRWKRGLLRERDWTDLAGFIEGIG